MSVAISRTSSLEYSKSSLASLAHLPSLNVPIKAKMLPQIVMAMLKPSAMLKIFNLLTNLDGSFTIGRRYKNSPKNATFVHIIPYACVLCSSLPKSTQSLLPVIHPTRLFSSWKSLLRILLSGIRDVSLIEVKYGCGSLTLSNFECSTTLYVLRQLFFVLALACR